MSLVCNDSDALYYNNEPYGGEDILKGELGVFSIKANNASSTWDDIVITAYGTPVSDETSGSGSTSSGGHEHEKCEDTLCLTAYNIGIEVQEKPWGGDWAGAEDSDTPTVNDKPRPWYHLWSENENAIRAVVSPQCLGDRFYDSSFSGLSVKDFEAPNVPPSDNAKPAWKMITGTIGNPAEVTPTICIKTVNNDDDDDDDIVVSLSSTQNKVDIVVNAIASVTWETKSVSATEDINGIPHYFAELHGNDATYHYPGLAIFPTFGNTPGKDKFHQASVRVSLAHAMPENMSEIEATVHLKCFDPPEGNVGALPLGAITLKFTQADSSSKTTIANFSEGFGDNFIVASHPNEGVVNKYQFDDDGKTLLKPGTQKAIPTTMRTDILYNAAWNGFKVPQTWVFDKSAYSIATETLDKIENSNGDLINNRENGESYAQSVLTFDETFRLTLNYRFDRTRGGNAYGYVLPATQKDKPKLSFVANSGVKIGSTFGASAGGYEIAILDVYSMVAMAGGINVFQQNGSKGIQCTQNSNNVDVVTVAKIPIPSFITATNRPVFATEPLNGLMHGVGYGKSYTNMKPHNIVGGSGWQKYWNILSNNMNDTGLSNTMIIQRFSDLDKTLSVQLNGTADYFTEKNPVFRSNNGHFYLQSHWGSGVVFTSVNLLL